VAAELDDLHAMRHACGSTNERNRVVHSVMMIETKTTNEPLYEAWHARSDTIWPVDPVALNTLARDLAQCAAEVSGFTHAWEERAERDGWPIL
jgi:hypothetical protein